MDIEYFAYAFSFRFIWIGWVVKRATLKPKTFADNALIEEFYDSTNIAYATVGFSKKAVMRRIEKMGQEKNSAFGGSKRGKRC